MQYSHNTENGRILALDLGRKRIGLAVSDPLGISAQGLPTLQRTTIREDIAAIEALAHGRVEAVFVDLRTDAETGLAALRGLGPWVGHAAVLAVVPDDATPAAPFLRDAAVALTLHGKRLLVNHP